MTIKPDYLRLVTSADATARELQREGDALILKSGGGDGTSGGMDALIDAKVAAAEARTDAKFAAVLGKLDVMSGELRSVTADVRAVRGSIWTAAFAIMGLIVAVVAIIATIVPFAFGAGSQYRDLAREEVRAVQAERRAVQASPARQATPSKPVASPKSK